MFDAWNANPHGPKAAVHHDKVVYPESHPGVPKPYDPNVWDSKNPLERATFLGTGGFILGTLAAGSYNAWHGLPNPLPNQKVLPYIRKVFTKPLMIGTYLAIATTTTSLVADMTNMVLKDGRPTFWGNFLGPLVGMNFLGFMMGTPRVGMYAGLLGGLSAGTFNHFRTITTEDDLQRYRAHQEYLTWRKLDALNTAQVQATRDAMRLEELEAIKKL